MINTNATNFRKKMFDFLNQAIVYNDVINVNTKNGNAVVMSDEDYRGMIETLYLMSHDTTAKSILKAKVAPDEEFVKYDPSEKW